MFAGTPLPFRLPPGVTVTRRAVADGVAYVFRHRQLGLLGRLIATEYPGQQTLLSAEVAGDAADPMTAERRAILEPLVEQLEARLMRQLGRDLPPDHGCHQHQCPSRGPRIASLPKGCNAGAATPRWATSSLSRIPASL